MNDMAIRRMYLSDEEWERTSRSWKEMKPLRNYNQLEISDESEEDCHKRLHGIFGIPLDVISQWIYPHYYNSNTVKNYGWIDYRESTFSTAFFDIEDLVSLNVIEEYRSYVKMREQSEPFKEFMCIAEDKECWGSRGTWRIPPIIIDVDSFSKPPHYSELTGRFQLIEGHSRLGYLLAMKRAGVLRKQEHKVYLLSGNAGV